MVHYDTDPAQSPSDLPHVCPKCGSHRTEVIGTADDSGLLIIRCNACGARSTVPAPNDDVPPNDFTAELAAMQAVGNALTQLHGDQSRVRVLRWATDRFQPGLPAAE